MTRTWPISDDTRSLIDAWAEHGMPDRRSLPDTDAASPTVKGCIDGLVRAGVLANDTPQFVRAVTYFRPIVVKGLPPALILTIEETM